MSRDPLGIGGGDAKLYAYTGNDPINFADPLGLSGSVGFGWPRWEALRLDRAEVIDAFRELEPLYRILRSVA